MTTTAGLRASRQHRAWTACRRDVARAASIAMVCLLLDLASAAFAADQLGHLVGHFTCYKVKSADGTGSSVPLSDVGLVDQFGASTVTVRRPKLLCTPTSKNGEAPEAPADPDHLVEYAIKPAVKQPPISPREMADQFGVTLVRVRKAIGLQVPSAKSLTSPPPVPESPAVDHFQCYTVKSRRTERFRARNVTIEDQFGTRTVTATKLRRLCAPVNKDGEAPGAESHAGHLLCYQIKQTTRPRFAPIRRVFAANQLALEMLDVKKPVELCLPGSQHPPVPMPTPAATATSEATPTQVSTPVITGSPPVGPTATRSAAPTAAPTPTTFAAPTRTTLATPTVTRTATVSPPRTPSATSTPRPTASAIATARPTATATPPRPATATTTPTVTASGVPATVTLTPTALASPRATPSRTQTPTRTPTRTAVTGATATASATRSATPVATRTATPVATRTVTPARVTATPVRTATRTPIPTTTRTATVAPTRTPTPGRTLVPTPAPTATPFCGNDVIEGDEECDGTDLDDNDCFDLCDDEGGTLTCKRNCTFDFSGCTAPPCEAD